MKVIAREELYEASTAETAADRVVLAPELTETVGWLDSHAARNKLTGNRIPRLFLHNCVLQLQNPVRESAGRDDLPCNAI
jgi:hypothetical protein